MNDRNGGAPPSDPAANNEVSVDSGWPLPLAGGESDSDGADNYFMIQGIGEATIIGPSERASAGSLAGTSSDCGGGRGPSGLNHHPSVSSSSSEDQKPPPEIPSSTKGIRKKGEKRIRQPRFAFVTKTEVDQLEDGFRWRKYGQKAVKNSPFPRSYYRCTNSKCTVKKRVERSSEDPTTVITTYEGQHCHHAVGFHRATPGFVSHESLLAAGHHHDHFSSSPNFYYAGGGGVLQLRPTIQHYYSHLQQPTNSSHAVGGGSQPHQMQQQSADEGLLGDMVPPGMRNI